MDTQEIHLELLLGKIVRDPAGERVGRIEEVRAEQEGDEWVVREYLVGRLAMLERLSAWTIGLAVLRALGAHKLDGHRVPWDRLDLSDPQNPRLCCTVAELPGLDE